MEELVIKSSFTNRQSLSIDMYLQEISRVPLLTLAEEVELAQRARTGDRFALEKLTRANLLFAFSVAKQYQNQGLSLPDLVNEGNIGLIRAAEKFDETRGFKFISYAVWWIRQSILQALSEQSRIIRLPRKNAGIVGKIKKKSMIFEQLNERCPSEEELAEMIDESLANINNTFSRIVSLDKKLVEENDDVLSDIMVDPDSPNPEKTLIEESLALDVRKVIHLTLSERDGSILKKFFGIDSKEMTREEIAEEFGLSKERVRQIIEKSKMNIRISQNKKILKVYLG